MYEVLGLPEELGKAIDGVLCKAVAPILGKKPEDLSDEAILGRLREQGGAKRWLSSAKADILDAVKDTELFKRAANESSGRGLVRLALRALRRLQRGLDAV